MATFYATHYFELPVGPEGGEDTVEIEVEFQCEYSPAEPEVCINCDSVEEATPTRFRYPSLGRNAPWIKFTLGTLDGDGYIYYMADEWAADNLDQFLVKYHEQRKEQEEYGYDE